VGREGQNGRIVYIPRCHLSKFYCLESVDWEVGKSFSMNAGLVLRVTLNELSALGLRLSLDKFEPEGVVPREGVNPESTVELEQFSKVLS
jgi:hypothetical protein